MRIGLGVDLPEKARMVHRVGALGDGPAILQHQRIDISDADGVLKSLEFSVDQRPMRPGAGPGNVKMIAPRFRLETAAALDAGPEQGRRAFEFSAGCARVIPLIGPCSVDHESHLAILLLRPCGSAAGLRQESGRAKNQAASAAISPLAASIAFSRASAPSATPSARMKVTSVTPKNPNTPRK